MKKNVVILDTMDPKLIKDFTNKFLKNGVTIITKNGIELWQVDEQNNWSKIF